MKKSFLVSLLFVFAIGFLYGVVSYAADGAAPDLATALPGLLGAIKDKAGAAVILFFAVEVLKSAPLVGVLGKINQKALLVIVPVLGVLGSVADQVAHQNSSWLMALVNGLVVSGGAMTIYEALKNSASKPA